MKNYSKTFFLTPAIICLLLIVENTYAQITLPWTETFETVTSSNEYQRSNVEATATNHCVGSFGLTWLSASYGSYWGSQTFAVPEGHSINVTYYNKYTSATTGLVGIYFAVCSGTSNFPAPGTLCCAPASPWNVMGIIPAPSTTCVTSSINAPNNVSNDVISGASYVRVMVYFTGISGTVPTIDNLVVTDVTLFTPTISPAGPTTICTSGSQTLTCTPNTSPASYQWQSSATGAAGTYTDISFSTNSTYSATTAGYYRCKVTNSSQSWINYTAGSQISIESSTITGTTPNSRCGAGTVTLGATASTGTISWYAASSGGSALGTGTSFTTPSISTSTTYYVYGTSNGCTVGTRTAVLATVNAIPAAPAAMAVNNCNGTSTLSTNATGALLWSTSQTTSAIIVSSGGTYSVTQTVNGCKSSAGTATALLNPCTVTLSMKMFIEGYYLGGGQMMQVLYNEGVDTNSNSTKVDTITVSLVDSVLLANDPNDNYYDADTVATAKGVLQTNGLVSVTFPGSVSGKKYYLMVTHRSAVQTWSANTVTIMNGSSYDFTATAGSTYGGNEVDVYNEGIWSFFSGDMNQDQNIDIYDFPILNSEVNQFDYGYYVGDLNGDGNVDIYDFPIYDANSMTFIYSLHP